MKGYNNIERVRYTDAQVKGIESLLESAVNKAAEQGYSIPDNVANLFIDHVISEVEITEAQYNDFGVSPDGEDLSEKERKFQESGSKRLRRQEQRKLAEIMAGYIGDNEDDIDFHTEYHILMAMISILESRKNSTGGLKSYYRNFIKEYEAEHVFATSQQCVSFSQLTSMDI